MSKKWYDEYPKAESASQHNKTTVEVFELKDEAKRYLSAETSAFQLKESKSNNSETMWLKTALSHGTISDKVAANIVFIQDNPKYNITRLASLISQVKTVKHNQCSMIIEALTDLFLSELLHPKFKLLKFEEQDLELSDNTKNVDMEVKCSINRNKLLTCWYFEDQLREQYERFIEALANVAQDTVDANREKAVSVMIDLLIGNAEQEHKLLDLIVNKIGDPAPKVASKAIFSLNKLLREHPNMRTVVLKEIEKLLFRKNVANRAQYYAICLLTQFALGKEDEELATTLTQVYFAFFKACLKKGEPDSRMMAAILTGVNKSYPFIKKDSPILSEHINSIYKIVHIGSYNVSLNALTLLYQATNPNDSQSDRFYTVFYKKLLDPQLGVMNKRAMFLNLLYRVLEKDCNILRVCASVKRILQVTLYFPANMACATLYVVSKVLQKNKNLQQVMCKNKFSDDSSRDRSPVKTEVASSEIGNNGSEPDSHQETSILLPNVICNLSSNTNDSNFNNDIKVEVNTSGETKKAGYDPFCRNPLYANADKSLTAELVVLSRHFHPSVALFANTIIQGKSIEYTGDPLEDLLLIRFLDRYAFKNPKKLEDKKVTKKGDPWARRSGYIPRGVRSIPIHSASYMNEKEDRIPVDELYLYRYLQKKKVTQYSGEHQDSDNESVNSEEFNDMLDQLGRSKDYDDVEELDIAADVKPLKTTKKKGKLNDDDKDDEDDEDNLSNDGSTDDERSADEDADQFDDLSDVDFSDIDDEDMSDMDFNEDSDNEVIDSEFLHSAMKNVAKTDKGGRGQRSKGAKKTKEINENVFMSAEKFAEMLEGQDKTDKLSGGTDAFSNLDGASWKQLEWETKRNEKLNKKGFFGKKRKSGLSGKNKNAKKFKR